MNDRRQNLRARNFPTAHDEAVSLKPEPLYEGPESSYRLAFTDNDFLLRQELRPVRMQLELLKPEMIQQEQQIESTIVIFGSARVLPPSEAQRRLDDALAGGRADEIRRAETAVSMSRYYEEARRFAGLVTTRSRSQNSSSSVPKPPGKHTSAMLRIRKCILRIAK